VSITPVITSPGLDALDSYYQFVRARILSVANNPTNNPPIVAGVLNAQDWPPKQVKLNAFYMLILGEEPVGKQGFSPAVPIKFHLIQWTWIIKGSDLQQGEQFANRGDRYRLMQAMKYQLTYGMSPNYCPKLTWNLVNEVWTGVPLIPAMAITWTPVDFHERFDKDSGLAYGTGSTRIQDILPPFTS
jgi:hypothetical protein